MNQLKHILNLNVDKYMHAQKLNRTEQKINENELKIKGKKGIEMREFSGGVWSFQFINYNKVDQCS